ncbi:MAG: preprotein translocase subunit YajC [Tissierellia bacterium]|nr:preprotein translocase subunit YajC [Tissierellia bacterium]
MEKGFLARIFGNSLSTIVIVLLIIALIMIIMRVFSILSMKKSKEYFEELHKSLKPGKEIMLTDGIYGKLVKVDKDFVMLEIAKGTVIKVSRYSIKEIID